MELSCFRVSSLHAVNRQVEPYRGQPLNTWLTRALLLPRVCWKPSVWKPALRGGGLLEAAVDISGHAQLTMVSVIYVTLKRLPT